MRLTFVYAGYQFVKFLGEGSFGAVFKAYKKAGPKRFAVKIMWHKKVPKQDIQSEIDALKIFDHPNIAKLYEVIHAPTQTCLIQEYCGTNLWDAAPLFNNHGPRIKNIFVQMVSALYFIHEKGYVHRDISPGNVLLSGANMDKVTIIDLGMTKPFTAYGKMKRLTSLCGTDGYAAPEIRPPYTDYEGGNSDLWSCGAILHFLVFLKDPFASIKGYYATTEDRPVLFTEKEKGFPYFDGYDSAEHLMKKMLQKLPENRYTWSDVIDHSWLEEYRPFFVRKYISLSESQSNPMPENEKHLLSEITMDESVNNTTILKMMSEAELPNNNHKTTMERIRKLKLKDLNIERLGTNESPQTSNESVQSSIEMLSVNQAEGSSQCNVMRVSKLYDDNGAFVQAPPAGQILPNPRDIFKKVNNNALFNPFGPVHPPNENNGSPNRIDHFLDDAAAPYSQLLNNSAPFYGPTANLVPFPVEKNALIKRKPVSVAKNKKSSIIVLPRHDSYEAPFRAPSMDLASTIILTDDCDMSEFAPPFQIEALLNVHTSESALLFENKVSGSIGTSEFAANELLAKDELLASLESKALSKHIEPSLKKDLPPSDHVTPASVSLKTFKVKITALSPHKGKISLRTITSISPDEMLRSIKKVLVNMGILNHMSGHQKMKCFRPRCEESSIIARIQNAISSLLSIDQGKDIRFTIQLNRLNKVPGFYAVNITRLQGSKTVFKELRKEILDSLNLYE